MSPYLPGGRVMSDRMHKTIAMIGAVIVLAGGALVCVSAYETSHHSSALSHRVAREQDQLNAAQVKAAAAAVKASAAQVRANVAQARLEKYVHDACLAGGDRVVLQLAYDWTIYQANMSRGVTSKSAEQRGISKLAAKRSLADMKASAAQRVDVRYALRLPVPLALVVLRTGFTCPPPPSSPAT